MAKEQFHALVSERVSALPRLIEPYNLERACSAPPPQRQSLDYVWADPNEGRPNLFACTDPAAMRRLLCSGAALLLVVMLATASRKDRLSQGTNVDNSLPPVVSWLLDVVPCVYALRAPPL